MTAVDHVALHARLQPGRVAAHEFATGATWTYAALDDRIARCAGALAADGLGVGDRLAVLAKNRVDLIVLHLACARLGAMYVPLNWRLSAGELAVLVADCDPRLTLADGDGQSLLPAAHDLDAFLATVAGAEASTTPPIDPTRPSLILYTSGTSGRPKGVLLTEANIAATAENFGLLARVGHASVFLCDSPMFHVIGLITAIRPILRAGGTILVAEGFAPGRTLARLGDPDLAVSHYFCVPQMAATLRAEPGFDPARLRGLTGMFSGGAPHAAAAIRAWLADGIAMVDGYGMSEAGTVTAMPLDRDLIAADAGAVGYAPPGVDTRIVDGSDRVAAPGAAGEIQLRGANVTPGYWRLPDATAAAFTADGWLRTGDIAVVDARGQTWIVDRRKDMFISGGENVYPAEIEAVLAAHPEVAECAVVGVPDARWGEVGHLFVAAVPGATPDPAALLAQVAAALARYKTPHAVSLVAALPRNGAGKVLKAELKTLWRATAERVP